MKVCFLINSLETKSGWGRMAEEIVGRLKEKKIEVIVIRIFEKKKSLLSLISEILRVRKIIGSCDIVHCFDGYPCGLVGFLANLFLGKKIIINIIGTWSVLPLYQAKYSFILEYVYHRVDKIVSISNFTAKEVEKKASIKNIEIITLGVDAEKFGQCSPVINKEKKKILSVGALKFRKGYHVSIKAFAEAKKEFPQMEYFIVGDQGNNKYFNLLKKIINELGVVDSVHFLYNLKDKELADLYCQADLFLLTPVNDGHSFEGFGLVYLEAAISGAPSVGVWGCGAEEAIKDGISGYLVPQNNIKETAEKIIKVMKNDKERLEMKEQSINWAKENGWNKTISSYVNLYERICTKNI